MQDGDLNKSLKSTERKRSGMSDEINTNFKVKDKIKPRLFFKLKKKEYKIHYANTSYFSPCGNA